MSGRAFGGALLAAVFAAGLLPLALSNPAAGAAAPCTWAISGSVHPSTAHVGDAMSVNTSVSAPARCGGTTVTISGEGGVLNQTLRTCLLPTGGGSCSVTFAAYKGLTAVRVRLSNGQSNVWNVTVVDTPQTSATKSSAPPPPTSTAPHPTTSAATTSASATKTKKKASPTATKTNPAPIRPDSPWETGALPSEDGPAPTDDATLEGSPIAVEVTHGSGGASPIPIGIVLVSLGVLAVVFGAVVRIIVVHNRPDTPR